MAYGPWKGQRWRTVWNNGYYRVDVKWDFCQDVENNKTMTAMCGQRVASLNGYYSFNYTACETGVGDFNGTKFPETRAVSVGGGGTTEIECTHRHSEVTHNADGSWPSGRFCGWWRFNVPLASHNVPTVGWAAFNIDGEIPTIPRATTPTLSASSVAMGSAVTINLPRASSAFTHNVTYRFGSATGTINSNAGTSCSWTPPVSLAQQIKTSTSGVGTITVQTKNGSTVIGTKTINITLTVPASVVPTISGHVVAEATANIASDFGAFVQSKSTLKVTTTAAGAQGSTITAYKTVIEGRSYTGSPCTSAAISGSGTIAVKTTVTDSRGRTATKTTNVTVVAYSPPQISVSNVARTSDEATTGTCTYNYSISPVGGKNGKVFYIQYLDGSTWTNIVRTSTSYSKSGSQTTGAIFGVDATTKVRFVAQDYFTSAIVEKEVGPTFTLMNFGAGGKSLAIGMLSSNMGTFQNALPTECFHLTTASGSSGFLKVLQLKVKATRWNYTGISFMFHKGAGNSLFTRATIIVNGGATTDPTPQIVLSSNPGIDPIYIHKSAANTWDVYIAKVGDEQVGLYDLNVYRPNLITVSKQNQWVESVPSGYITSRWEHLDTVYPVGSVKLTWDAVNPGTRLGGTWVQFSQGRVLIGQGTGSDGSTSMTFATGSAGGRYTSDQINLANPQSAGFIANSPNYADRCIVRKESGGWTASERDANIKLIQPYQTVVAWRRTA